MSLILQLKDVKGDDLISLGEKLLLYCDLSNNQISVPNSFIITNELFLKFLEETELILKIKDLTDSTNYNRESYNTVLNQVQELIMNTELPPNILNDIKNAYDNMIIHNDIFKSASIQTIDFIRAGRSAPYLAVRPYLRNNRQIEAIENIRGIDNLGAAVKRIFCLYFNTDVLIKDNMNDLNIVIQKMINPDKSAIVSVFEDSIEINACFGLSQPMTNNEIQFDNYILDKSSLQLKEYKINNQEWMLYRDENLLRTIKRNLYIRGKEQKLNYNEFDKIVETCSKLKELNDLNYKFEFIFENNRIYLIDIINLIKEDDSQITQEPLEAFNFPENNIENISSKTSDHIQGETFYYGKSEGPVKILRSLDDLSKVNYNDIIACRYLKSEFIGAIEKASGIISDSDISQEIQDMIKIPCIINSVNATQLLNDNDYVEVDASAGVISKIEKKAQPTNNTSNEELPFRLDIKIDENTNVDALLEKIRQVKEFLKK
ncbi:hypothetical protein J4471_01185 [Candidatus Woesearchaeota archaeon]|nr:hypothetical protein [Candidatus Woesearchaeota archaeon]